MKLTDREVKAAKPKAAKYTLSDGQGLTLLVLPAGSKYWRLRYYFGGKRRVAAVGKPYPRTSLADARVRANEFRTLLAKGQDPAEHVREGKSTVQQMVANTFGKAADAWYDFRAKMWNVKTAAQARHYLDRDLLPKLRSRPLDRITPMELGHLVEGIEQRGAFDVAKKTRQWLKAIFSYARAKGWTKNDPAGDLQAVMQKGPGVHNYAHLQVAELPGFLHALDAYNGSQLVKACAKLSLWTANRPGVTRTLRWDELDLDAGLWTIGKGRDLMKRGYAHVTPLPTQAIALLRDLKKVSGQFEHVFVGRNDPSKPICDGAVAGMLKTIGYRGKQTAHGFRHLISTALNEQGYSADHVERQLAHGDPDNDKIRGIYNKAAYLDPRRKMMQAWADHLDRLMTSGGNVIEGNFAKVA
jgi:integrase